MILALSPPALQYQLPALLFVCVLFGLFLLFIVVLSGEQKQNQGRGLVDRKLLFRFGSLVVLDVVWLYFVILVRYKTRK